MLSMQLEKIDSGLEGQTIPGSFYQGPDREYGFWHIKTVERVVFDGHPGLFVMVNNSHGDCFQGVAPPSDHAIVVATIDALDTARRAELEADYDFNALCDMVAA